MKFTFPHNLMLTATDQHEITLRGVSIEEIHRQITIHEKGIPYINLLKPCTVSDGITQLNPSNSNLFTKVFKQAVSSGRVTKFVPASGAASRMFKALLTCCTDPSNQSAPTVGPSDKAAVENFFKRLSDFAFYEDLSSTLRKQGHQLTQHLSQSQHQIILDALLFPRGLNYAKLPKGLLPFHRYPDHIRTPIEEHLIEAAVYAKDASNQAHVHFTISPAHQEAVQEHLESARQRFKQDCLDWIVTCSLQKPSSDTIAVDMENQPFRDHEGNLLFRPAGHGTLLSNVNELQGDIVFIKNIDNVVPDHLKEETYIYKRALGGYLITIQETLFEHLRQLETETITATQLDDIVQWAQSALYWTNPPEWKDWDLTPRATYLRQFCNRPIRVCGMVKNTGDPGGGPFWVKHEDGTTTLQIVESSQVDLQSSEQQHIFASSTHFNPVDMVCGVRDYQGNPFDLNQFVDPDAGFISRKSYEGRELKALELPGLWNGAMAKWHTIFVEVPRHTFNPVKTVLDLLLPAHQPQ